LPTFESSYHGNVIFSTLLLIGTENNKRERKKRQQKKKTEKNNKASSNSMSKKIDVLSKCKEKNDLSSFAACQREGACI
jgi:hypothetical protein